ncbi:MAG: HoxN/HupN/NixA family nickel/cobalt transporter [Trebonia sp.]
MALQAARSRLRRIAGVMTPREWFRFGAMLAFILAINAVGWGIYVLYVMPHHFTYKGEGSSAGLGVGIGVAITAWFLGFRHAFDADHISCIDNTTRKLMADGKRPIGTGFFFSFGHSTVIVGVGVGITFAARAVFGAMVDPDSTFETAGGAIGTLLSAGFLYLIALLNLIVLSGIFKVFREMRQGTYNEVELEAQLQARGLMYRFFGRFMRSINHTWQLYFVGLVFGIGFDTTTEVLLLAATTYAAIQGLPFFAVLALPFLFSGGMMLFDTLDGAFMNFAYGWAFAKPVRKVYYNLVITALSIGAAFIIGTIEILGILTSEFHLNGGFWNLMANFNINLAGFCIAGMFIAVWAAAIIYWRAGNVEKKWDANVATVPAESAEGTPRALPSLPTLPQVKAGAKGKTTVRSE